MYIRGFENFCNGLHSGFIKPWKAHSILNTLTDVPQILKDHDRLVKYLSNCLLMEGFSQDDIEKIQKYLIHKFS